MRRKTPDNKPSAEEMLEFVLARAVWPYKLTIDGPSIARTPDQAWCLQYVKLDGVQGLSGCCYAPTRDEAIAKAMRLHAAQEKAKALVEAAAG